jgi:hypothetical protein
MSGPWAISLTSRERVTKFSLSCHLICEASLAICLQLKGSLPHTIVSTTHGPLDIVSDCRYQKTGWQQCDRNLGSLIKVIQHHFCFSSLSHNHWSGKALSPETSLQPGRSGRVSEFWPVGHRSSLEDFLIIPQRQDSIRWKLLAPSSCLQYGHVGWRCSRVFVTMRIKSTC